MGLRTCLDRGHFTEAPIGTDDIYTTEGMLSCSAMDLSVSDQTDSAISIDHPVLL